MVLIFYWIKFPNGFNFLLMGNSESELGEINKNILKKEQEETKILFLGLPGSGVMNLVESLKMTSNEKNQEYSSIIQYTIHQVVIQYIKCCEILEIALKKDLQKTLKDLKELTFTIGVTDFTEEYGIIINNLWEKVFQKVYEKRTELRLKQFPDIKNSKYWMENIKRISKGKYIPTNEDVQHYKDYFTEDQKGIEELRVTIQNSKFRIFYVEGQKTSNENWSDCFEGVDIVAFLCPIGDFDVNKEKNIVIESLQFFGKMCNSKWFINTPIILLFSKYEEFEEKTKDTDLICCFQDYLGGCVFESALRFINQKFFDVRKSKVVDEIYVYYIEKTTKNVEIVTHIHGIVKDLKFLKNQK